MRVRALPSDRGDPRRCGHPGLSPNAAGTALAPRAQGTGSPQHTPSTRPHGTGSSAQALVPPGQGGRHQHLVGRGQGHSRRLSLTLDQGHIGLNRLMCQWVKTVYHGRVFVNRGPDDVK